MMVSPKAAKEAGDKLPRELADEFLAMRGKTQPPFHTPDEMIDIALKEQGPVVVADPSDNPGGGAPGEVDSSHTATCTFCARCR